MTEKSGVGEMTFLEKTNVGVAVNADCGRPAVVIDLGDGTHAMSPEDANRFGNILIHLAHYAVTRQLLHNAATAHREALDSAGLGNIMEVVSAAIATTLAVEGIGDGFNAMNDGESLLRTKGEEDDTPTGESNA